MQLLDAHTYMTSCDTHIGNWYHAEVCNRIRNSYI